MKKNLKRALTTAVAGVMSVNCLALSSVLQAGAATAKYEFESGKLTGDAEVKPMTATLPAAAMSF